MSKLPLWGDGFAADTLNELWRVTSWDEISPDECVLYFPRLARRDAAVPQILLARLEKTISARVSHVSSLSETSRNSKSGWLTRMNSVFGGPVERPSSVVALDRNTLPLLQELLSDLIAGRTPNYDDDTAALAAFGSGIHPAYIWPEAAVCATRGVVAGWLGHLDRGRAALIPEVVAEYLEDALSGDRVDTLILELCGGEANRRYLLKAASRRLRGQDPVVRLKRPVRSAASSSLGLGFREIAAGARA